MPTEEEVIKSFYDATLSNSRARGIEISASPETFNGNFHHHYERATPTFNFKIEKNSRGANWSITVENVTSEDEARQVYRQAKIVVDEIIAVEGGEKN